MNIVSSPSPFWMTYSGNQGYFGSGNVVGKDSGMTNPLNMANTGFEFQPTRVELLSSERDEFIMEVGKIIYTIGLIYNKTNAMYSTYILFANVHTDIIYTWAIYNHGRLLTHPLLFSFMIWIHNLLVLLHLINEYVIVNMSSICDLWWL